MDLLLTLLSDLDQEAQKNAYLLESEPAQKFHITHIDIQQCLIQELSDSTLRPCYDLIEKMASERTPYTLFIYHFGILKNFVVSAAIKRENFNDLREVMKLWENLEDRYAETYLKVFLNRLQTRNHLRLSHLRSLTDKNILTYYEQHLVWIAQLAAAVEAGNADGLPELDHNKCEFGSWLYGKGTDIIKDKSHLKHLDELHISMHREAIVIRKLLLEGHSSAPIYALVKKAEHYSLELGNEIALMNSIVIMTVYNKDPLTGFLNRRFLEKVMINQMEIAKATETPFSIIMIDLDHFKKLNDTHGHQTGDKALVHISDIIRKTVRQSDLVFRYGGEEFLLVLPSANHTSTYVLAEKLRHAIEKTPLPENTPIFLTASFGVQEISPDDYSVVDRALVREAIAQCDGKLYAAKRQGRNRIF